MKEPDIGLVIPVSRELAERILEGAKDIIVKNLSHPPVDVSKHRLRSGMKLVLYVSHSARELAGEAEIHNIEFLSSTSVLAKYQSRLLLDKNEFRTYTIRPWRPPNMLLMVLTIKNPRRYPSGTRYPKTISLAGEYLKQTTYNNFGSQPSQLHGTGR